MTFRRLTVLLAFCLFPISLFAQSSLERLSLEVGLVEGAYIGERSPTSESGLAQIPDRFAAGWDLGLAYALTQRWDVIARYRGAVYPGLITNSSGHTILNDADSEEERSEWRFETRRDLFRLWRFETFGSVGFASIAGELRGVTSRGSGPVWGLGASIKAGPVTLIGGAEHTIVFPNRALDWAGETEGSDALVSAYVRMAFSMGGSRKGQERPKPDRISQEPVRIVVSVPSSARVGEEISLSALIPDAPMPESVQWEIGPDVQLEGPIVRYRFTQPGDVLVRVHVHVQENGQVTTLESSILVDDRSSPARIARIMSSPAQPVEGQLVTFSPQISGDQVRCLWTFGDGSSDVRECETTHRFDEPGSYDVRLVVSNPDDVDIAIKPITVSEDACRAIEALRPVYFARNSSELSLDMRESLRDNFSDSAQCIERMLEIRGFAFNTERDAEALARARARSVLQYYVNLGMRSAKVEVAGYSVIDASTHPGQQWTGRRSESRLRLQ